MWTTCKYGQQRLPTLNYGKHYEQIGSITVNLGQQRSTSVTDVSGIQTNRRDILNMFKKVGVTTDKSWVYWSSNYVYLGLTTFN